MANMETKEIDNIVITYKDGTQRELDKGMVVSTIKDEHEVNIHMAMLRMSGQDFQQFMESMAMAYLELNEQVHTDDE